MKLKSLITGLVGGAVMAATATLSLAETTMEKIVRTGQMTIAVQTQGPPSALSTRMASVPDWPWNWRR